MNPICARKKGTYRAGGGSTYAINIVQKIAESEHLLRIIPESRSEAKKNTMLTSVWWVEKISRVQYVRCTKASTSTMFCECRRGVSGDITHHMHSIQQCTRVAIQNAFPQHVQCRPKERSEAFSVFEDIVFWPSVQNEFMKDFCLRISTYIRIYTYAYS